MTATNTATNKQPDTTYGTTWRSTADKGRPSEAINNDGQG